MTSRFKFSIGTLGLAALSLAGGGSPISVSKYSGKFQWVKVPALSPAALKSLHGATKLSFDVTFAANASVTKDKGGNQWFTFIVADQDSKWKWFQGSKFGGVPVTGGMIKAGKYKVTVPLTSIPASVLAGAQQTVSLGPSASGLAKPISFSIDNVHGTH